MEGAATYTTRPADHGRGRLSTEEGRVALTFQSLWRCIDSMLSRLILTGLSVLFLLPGPGWAVEAAPDLTDREIAERLTRLEKGQSALRTEMGQLRADMNRLREDMNRQNQHLREDMNRQNQQLRADMGEQIAQLRADMNTQFERQFRLTLALLGAFTGLLAATIGFALWDRRSLTRPFEDKIKSLEDEFATNRPRLQALLESLRRLSQRDPELAAVLKSFNL